MQTIDPSMKNEQRRMAQILNEVKQKKDSKFSEQLKDEQRQLQQSAQKLYGTGKYNQDLTASAEFIEHVWDKHPELLASNGGPTLRKSSFYEDEDGNISQNPYYHH